MADLSSQNGSTYGGQLRPVAVPGISVVDTDTQSTCGGLLESIWGNAYGKHHPWPSRGGFFGQKRSYRLNPFSHYQWWSDAVMPCFQVVGITTFIFKA
jgi:hypothetical protein